MLYTQKLHDSSGHLVFLGQLKLGGYDRLDL